MAEAKPHLPCLRFAAVFGQQVEALDWACQQASRHWGDVLLQSDDIEFDMTSFYQKSMGDLLKKRLVAFRPLLDPTDLVQSKVDTNRWESEFKSTEAGSECDVSRPVNIDPGYLTEAKVVLMTTKDRDHRLYMGQGIYAEVTLFYKLPGVWESSRWTYPDYQLPSFHDFFFRCRHYLRQQLQQAELPTPDSAD